jgi:predicted Zn-dependent protease
MRYLLLFLIMILGCSSMRSRDISIWIDERFDKDEKIEIKKAITDWNWALNGRIVIADEVAKVDLDRGFGEVWAVVKQKPEEVGDDIDKKVLAYVYRENNAIYVIRERIEDEIAISYIMRHEIGHLLGIEHTDRYLMYQYFSWNWFKCIDQVTAGEIAKKWGLRIWELNYCNRED